MRTIDLSQEIAKLPKDASEAVVSSVFVQPLLNILGFDSQECYPSFPTGKGQDRVDFAARSNKERDDIFLQSKAEPYLLVEVKGRATSNGVSIKLQEGTAQYTETREQLKRYLFSSRCSTAKWGIITNSNHIQLFRRHGKVVVPATACLEITSNNLNQVVNDIRNLIKYPPKALSVCIYNNKGGIGKTTTTINLATALAAEKQKILVVDFDVHQQDLSNILQVNTIQGNLYECLINRSIDICSIIQNFTATHKGKTAAFDVITATCPAAELSNPSLFIERVQGGISRLRDTLQPLIHNYDYVLIDTPPNWTFFSQSGIWASDVVFIPTRADDVSSLENAATAISTFIPEISKARQDGGPIALPIFFNGQPATETQIETAKDRLRKIVDRVKIQSSFDLNPFFFPKHTRNQKNFYVFKLPGHASVTKGPFQGILSSLMHKTTEHHYHGLAKEYFLQ